MFVKRLKKEGECFGCKRKLNKKEFKRKSLQGNSIFVCQKCGYYNSPAILEEIVNVKGTDIGLSL